MRVDDTLKDFLDDGFKPKRLEDLELAEVDPCTPENLEKELHDLEANKDLTDSHVKVIFVVINDEDFRSGNCEEELDSLQYQLEELSCDDIRSFEDFLTIQVDSGDTECKANKLKDAVLEE